MLTRARYTVDFFTIAVTIATIAIAMPTHAISPSPFQSSLVTNMADNSAFQLPYFYRDLNPLRLIRTCREYIQKLDISQPTSFSFVRGDNQNTNSFDEHIIRNLGGYVNENGNRPFNDVNPFSRDSPRSQNSPSKKEFLGALTQADFLRINRIITSREERDRPRFFLDTANTRKQALRRLNQRCLQHGLDRLLEAREEDIPQKLRKEGNVENNRLGMAVSLALSSEPRLSDDDVTSVPMASNPEENNSILSSPSSTSLSSSSLPSSQSGRHFLRFNYKTTNRSNSNNLVERKRAGSDETVSSVASSKRGYSAWLRIVRRVRAKRRHRLSINNALMSLTNMLLEDNRQRTLKNRAKMRYHMYLQG